MFTQTDSGALDRALRRIEEVGYPLGVVLLATGRLLGDARLARVGGVLVAVGIAVVAVVVLRCLVRARVPWTPMLSRYAVGSVAMLAWALLAGTTWATGALGVRRLFGTPGSMHLLLTGVVGFVVLGTLYHVVPFLIWVHRYSDRLGLEAVPMIDDLYDDRLARADFALTVAGASAWSAADLAGRPASGTLALVGSLLLAVGFVVFAANLSWTIRRHSPGALVARFERTDASDAPPGG